MLPERRAKPSPSAAGPVEPWTISSSAPPVECPSYPPTEVRRWLTCPVFRDYSKRWASRVEDWTPHRLVGTAIHAGVAAHLQGVMRGDTAPPDGLDHATEALRAGYVQQETWGLDGLAALVSKGTTALRGRIAADLLPGATILGVEQQGPKPLPPGVRVPRTLDCVLKRDDHLEVWDWKTAIRLDAQYFPEKARSVLHQWQLLDYGWHAQEWYQLPVTRVGHGLVILGPKLTVKFLPVEVSPARLRQWRIDALRIWRLMREHEMSPWHNWEACTDRHLHYGRECKFMSACHELNGEESQFGGRYRSLQVEGTP